MISRFPWSGREPMGWGERGERGVLNVGCVNV